MTDAPEDNHGLGQMFSPTDLLSTSLAACVATIIGIHVNSKDYELISIDANIQKKMASQPRRVAAIKIEFVIEVSSVASDQDLVLLERLNAPIFHPYFHNDVRTRVQQQQILQLVTV